MFSGIKAYAAGIGLVVVLALLGYLIYDYDSTKKKNANLQTEVTVKKIENKDQAKTIELTEKSGQITTSQVIEHASDVKQVDKSFEQIDREAEKKYAEIKNKYKSPQPKPESKPGAGGEPAAPVVLGPTQPTPQEQEISAVRIDTLWQGYCLVAPAETPCKPEKKQ